MRYIIYIYIIHIIYYNIYIIIYNNQQRIRYVGVDEHGVSPKKCSVNENMMINQWMFFSRFVFSVICFFLQH